MKRSTLLAPAVGLAAVLLSSCYGSNSNPSPNPGSGAELNSGTLNNGQSYGHTFAKTGTFNYKCTIHSTCQGLYGTVVVVDASVPIQAANHHAAISQGDGGACFTLSVPFDSVKAGETVTWTTNSQSSHTVTDR